MQTHRGFPTEARKRRSFCALLIIIIEWGSRFEGPVAAHVHVQEGKNDQMVSQTFQKATEVYSSQFVCCLSTNDGKKYIAAVVQNSASVRSVYEICASCAH